VAACPVGALAFDYKHQIIQEAHRRVATQLHHGPGGGRRDRSDYHFAGRA
jgi:hypothetical protein